MGTSHDRHLGYQRSARRALTSRQIQITRHVLAFPKLRVPRALKILVRPQIHLALASDKVPTEVDQRERRARNEKLLVDPVIRLPLQRKSCVEARGWVSM